MTPFEKYLEFDPNALDLLKKCTHIYLDNNVFVCGYKTHSYYITKKNHNKLDKPDTWYVVYALGNIKKLFSVFEPLPYLCYHREDKDKKIRLLDYKKFRNKYYGQKK